MRLARLLAAAAIFAAGCEDGPKRYFEPNNGNPEEQNGYDDQQPWTQDGSKGFTSDGSSDAAGRAKFCDETEYTTLLQGMVVAPILPDVSVGSLPLWAPGDKPLEVDTLIGRPEDGKFCEPEWVYSNAFAWGPEFEVAVFFDSETRLLEGIQILKQYLGVLEGVFTKENTDPVKIILKPRDRAKICRDGPACADVQELTQYSSTADQASNPDSWMNHQNITQMYRMVRKQFWGEDKLDTLDCVATKLCSLFYEHDNESLPQTTAIYFVDSGVMFGFTADGFIDWMWIQPVRMADFEREVSIDFDATGGNSSMSPKLTSISTIPALAGCTFTLAENLPYGGVDGFSDRCANTAATLDRANFDVWTARDAVTVEFNSINLGFLRRDVTTNGVFQDGERPADTDTLFSIEFGRTLDAVVAQYKARTLALAYAPRLEALLQSWVTDHPSGTPLATSHPFWAYTVTVPPLQIVTDGEGMSDTAQRIGELEYFDAGGVKHSWIPELFDGIADTYNALTLEEREMMDAKVLVPVNMLYDFVDVVLNEFTFGASDGVGVDANTTPFKVFSSSEDKRWAVVTSHFFLGSDPYRVTVQYSRNYDAVTYVIAAKGQGDVDIVFDDIRKEMNTLHTTTESYYTLAMSQYDDNPYRLGVSSLIVNGYDRQAETLDVTLTTVSAGVTGTTDMTVVGDYIGDENGFMRQLRGERWEFVPANVVKLHGKETSLTLYMDAGGMLSRIVQNTLKGSLELCPLLPLQYGDQIRERVEAWQATEPAQALNDCDVVYNYTENGNVLESVVSLTHKTQFFINSGEVQSAAIWR